MNFLMFIFFCNISNDQKLTVNIYYNLITYNDIKKNHFVLIFKNK